MAVEDAAPVGSSHKAGGFHNPGSSQKIIGACHQNNCLQTFATPRQLTVRRLLRVGGRPQRWEGTRGMGAQLKLIELQAWWQGEGG